jgi:hypothetical protein
MQDYWGAGALTVEAHLAPTLKYSNGETDAGGLKESYLPPPHSKSFKAEEFL